MSLRWIGGKKSMELPWWAKTRHKRRDVTHFRTISHDLRLSDRPCVHAVEDINV
jgi:hypothetical protein